MTPWVTRLLIANVGMFFLQMAAPGLWVEYLVFRPRFLLTTPWTPFTYMFLHGGMMHLLFNMIGLFFFGPRLEERIGGSHFISLYILSGLTGAALSFLTPNVSIVGASGAVFGVFIGFAMFWPRERIYIWGILPVEAWLLVLVMTIFSIGGGISGGGRIAHYAHLGGYVGGFLYIKWMQWRSPARQFKRRVESAAQPRAATEAELVARWRAIPVERLHEINRTEVERLLAKIDEWGVRSLTPDERTVLERFSRV